MPRANEANGTQMFEADDSHTDTPAQRRHVHAHLSLTRFIKAGKRSRVHISTDAVFLTIFFPIVLLLSLWKT